jgi:hypothetical protein
VCFLWLPISDQYLNTGVQRWPDKPVSKKLTRLIFVPPDIYSRAGHYFGIAGLGKNCRSLLARTTRPGSHRDDEFHYTENSALVFCDTE